MSNREPIWMPFKEAAKVTFASDRWASGKSFIPTHVNARGHRVVEKGEYWEHLVAKFGLFAAASLYLPELHPEGDTRLD